MADFSLQDLWWLRPKEQDNPLPALQLGANIAQNKARLDLAERDLANDIARTSLMREEMLHKQKLQTSLVAGNAAIAGAIASVDDWTDPEQVQRVYEVGAQYPMVVGSKAWQGAEYMQRNATDAAIRRDNTRSLIESRQDRAELGRLREERRALLEDSTIDVNDARIAQYDRNIALEERRLLVQEGNLGLRGREVEGKETRLGLREQYLNERNAIDREEKDKLATMSATSTEADTLRKLYNLKRREVSDKFYGPNAPKVEREGLKAPPPPPITPPTLIAPATKVRVIAPDGRPGFIPESQLEEALKAGYKRP